MLNLFNPKQTSKIGVITFTDHSNNKKVEVNVEERFWGCGYQPNVGQILVYLTTKKGYRHITNPTFCAIM